MSSGLTILELLVVLARVGAIASIAVMSGRPLVQSQSQEAGYRTVQQSVRQGATKAASRGVRTELKYGGSALTVSDKSTGKELRTFDLPAAASINVASGTTRLELTPPGKVDLASMAALPDPLTIFSNGWQKATECTLGKERPERENSRLGHQLAIHETTGIGKYFGPS